MSHQNTKTKLGFIKWLITSPIRLYKGIRKLELSIQYLILGTIILIGGALSTRIIGEFGSGFVFVGLLLMFYSIYIAEID